MIEKSEENSLLLADDLYNTYYHFCLVLSRQCHIIVPGKRDRNYKIIRRISDYDEIVEISKTARPDYVDEDEWKSLPKTILLRRITYAYPTKNGTETAVLYTTILNDTIIAPDIVAKYTMRWDIEISIREIKTLMDINVLRSKSRDMLFKELIIALIAYNMVRKLIAKSADKVGFPPQEDIFQKCSPFGRTVLLDKKGRVFFKWSPGRLGYTNGANR
jgi:IS4 transposase